MNVSFLLLLPKKKFGKTAIYSTATYRGQRAIIFPGESIDVANWINKDKINKPRPIADNNALKGRLVRVEQIIRDTHDNLQKTTQGIVPSKVLEKAVRDILFPPVVENDKNKVLIASFFQTLIDDSASGERKTKDDLDLNPNSIKPYKSALNHFKTFQEIHNKQYYLTDINQKLINEFAKFLNGKLAINASAKYSTVFKLLISYATEKKLIDFNVALEFKVNVRREKADNIYLTEKEVKAIMALTEFSTQLYETVRDLFVIGCNTGLRFSDYSILRLENINDGFITIDPGKTLRNSKIATKVIIPVHPMVKQILLKYPAGLPKCPPNQVFNRYLKEIGKQISSLDQEFEKKITRSHKVERIVYKKWQLLQTHSARRSFCTNMYLKGVPTITIRAISGHKTEESFLKYIKAENQQHADILKIRFDEDEKKDNE